MLIPAMTVQVMRIPRGSRMPDLVLGEKLVPGSDDSHFCKPSDVAVLPTGEFFVADGYDIGVMIITICLVVACTYSISTNRVK